MYVAQKTALPSTSVTFSLSGNFIIRPSSSSSLSSSHVDDLVVITDNVLTLYEVVVGGGGISSSSYSSSSSIDTLTKSGSLKYVAHVTLAATPTAANKITIGGNATNGANTTSGGSSSAVALSSPTTQQQQQHPDQIVLAFDHEHLSVIQYDPITCSFVTSALYRLGESSFVGGGSGGGGGEACGVPSILAVDPLNRCLAMLIRRRYLAIIPILQPQNNSNSTTGAGASSSAVANGAAATTTQKKAADNWGDDEDEEEEGVAAATTAADEPLAPSSAAATAPLLPAYQYFCPPKYLDLLALSPERIKDVRDMAFVPAATGEPTIAFLWEREATWAGRAKLIDVAAGQRTANLATCCITWLVVQSGSMFTSSSVGAGLGGDLSDGNELLSATHPLQTHQAVTSLLPFNTTRLVPCALPNCDAGFLVLAANTVLHVTRTRASGYYLNDHGEEEARCATNTRIHWSPLTRPQRKVERLSEHNLGFSDAVALMLSSSSSSASPNNNAINSNNNPLFSHCKRAVLSCPVSGLLCALDMTVSGRDVTAMTLWPIGPAAIASTLTQVGFNNGNNGASSAPFANFFLGSAVGDSVVLSLSTQSHEEFSSSSSTAASNSSSSLLANLRAFPWAKTILKNYGPIVGIDVGDFTTVETIADDDDDNAADSNPADVIDSIIKGDEGGVNADDDKDKTPLSTATIPNPYKALLSSAIAPDTILPPVPLQDQLNAADAIFVGGEGQYGHVTIGRQSIRPTTIVTQQGDCVGIFLSNPNEARKKQQEEQTQPLHFTADNNNGGKRQREDGGEVDEDEDENRRRLSGSASTKSVVIASSLPNTTQLLFQSYPNATHIFELSDRVSRIGLEKKKKNKSKNKTAETSTFTENENENNKDAGDNDNKDAEGKDDDDNEDDDEDEDDDEEVFPWTTDARTVWAGAATCSNKASRHFTRLLQVTDRSVVIVDESIVNADDDDEDDNDEDGDDAAITEKKQKGLYFSKVRRELVAEIELIRKESPTDAVAVDNTNDNEAATEKAAAATSASASSSAAPPPQLRHAFTIPNSTLLCATSTAGVTYLVDFLNPSVQILNDLLLAAILQQQQQQGNNAPAASVVMPMKITSVCDGSDVAADLVSSSALSSSSTAAAAASGPILFVADSSKENNGSLHIIALNNASSSASEVNADEDDEDGDAQNASASASSLLSVSIIASIASFAQLPSTVLKGEVPESVLDVKKPSAAAGKKKDGKKDANAIDISEMCCSNMSSSSLRTSASSSSFLYVLSDCGEIAVYKLRLSDLSFFKINQRFVDREFVEEKLESLEEKKKKLNVGGEDAVTVQDTTLNVRNITQRLVKFSDLTGVQASSSSSSLAASSTPPLPGVFVCGRRSSVFFSRDGKIIHHHVQTSSPLRSFCEIGSGTKAIAKACFVIAGEGYTSYCAPLDKKTNFLEEGWCMRRELLRKTPHAVGYVPQHRACFVITSEKTPFRPARAPFDLELKITTDEETGQPLATSAVPRAVQPFIPITANVPVPLNDRYTVNLFNAVPWKQHDSLTLEENEQVLCTGVGTLIPEVDGLPITDDRGLPQHMTVFAVGTAFPLGEDITCRGRLILLKPSVPIKKNNKKKSDNNNSGATDADGTATTTTTTFEKKIITIHSEDCKGPVTAITFIKSYIAVTIAGTLKIYAYDSKSNRLTTVSFLGAGNFIPKMVAFKDFILYGDLFNSVTLAKLHGGDKTTYILGKHAKEFEVSTVDIAYKGKEMGFVVGGARGQALLLRYHPQRDREGNVVGGKLVEEAGSRLSAAVSTTLRLRVPKPTRAEYSDEALVFYTTAGGEIGFIQPVSERISRILTSVNKTMAIATPHVAGLDPTSFKAIPSEGDAFTRGISTNGNTLIDGDSVTDFLKLSFSERLALANAAKVSQDRVLNAICGLSEQTFLVL